MNEKKSKNFRIKEGLFKNKKKKPKKTEDEAQEIKRLSKEIETNLIPEPSAIKKFIDFPISKSTMYGLKEAGYLKPTEIQKESIGLALRGLDILGAAKTGSGKTLAFIIPVLEKLYLNKWTKLDGLGALIITPTRELATQIFTTLNSVGKKHDFSVSLVIGGQNLKFEKKRLDQVNIIICTPGRILQHMDQNPEFDCSNLQILVLDEADRCLDMGFERDMNAIIENLPHERQTLLFSATQTKSVKDLARLSLKSPVYVSVHENSQFSTPELLDQSYVVCPLETKLDFLWSFIRHHRKKKILVFLSSCKQVRFVNLLFCRMRPGMTVLALYGSLHQQKRNLVYTEFCRKQAVVMFATDIAARGLDFPSVDWVVQLDCPEDPNTYIHRAGRTARYNKQGEALLVLLPSEEEAMVEELTNQKIPIQKIRVDQKKLVSVRRKFEALLARDPILKECAQRAFKAYLKAVFLMKNKKVFDISKLDMEAFGRSLGLAVAPRVRFLQKRNMGQKCTTNKNDDLDIKLEVKSESEVSVDEDEEPTTNGSSIKSQPLKSYDFSLPDEDSDDADDLFKSKKPANIEEDAAYILEEPVIDFSNGKKSKKPKSQAALAKKLLKKKIQINKISVFNDEGVAVPDVRKERQSEMAKDYEREDASGIDIERAKQILKEEDQYDKQIFRERIRTKHREERIKKKLAKKGMTKEDQEEEESFNHQDDEIGPRLAGNDDGDSGSEPDLDWLPDPDKIYGPKGSSSEEEFFHGNFDDDEDDVDTVTRPGKRRIEVVGDSDLDEEFEIPVPPKKNTETKLKKVKAKESKKRKVADTNLDKNLMEELALQLLSK